MVLSLATAATASEETLNGVSERLHLRDDYHRCIPSSLHVDVYASIASHPPFLINSASLIDRTGRSRATIAYR